MHIPGNKVHLSTVVALLFWLVVGAMFSGIFFTEIQITTERGISLGVCILIAALSGALSTTK